MSAELLRSVSMKARNYCYCIWGKPIASKEIPHNGVRGESFIDWMHEIMICISCFCEMISQEYITIQKRVQSTIFVIKIPFNLMGMYHQDCNVIVYLKLGICYQRNLLQFASMSVNVGILLQWLLSRIMSVSKNLYMLFIGTHIYISIQMFIEKCLGSHKRSCSLWFSVSGNRGHPINDGGGKITPETTPWWDMFKITSYTSSFWTVWNTKPMRFIKQKHPSLFDKQQFVARKSFVWIESQSLLIAVFQTLERFRQVDGIYRNGDVYWAYVVGHVCTSCILWSKWVKELYENKGS